MKQNYLLIYIIIFVFSTGCEKSDEPMSIKNKAVFLHHSTGNIIWKGNTSKVMYKIFKEGDNVYIWDFYSLETEGGLYLKEDYAGSATNSHPNKAFAEKVTPLFAEKIVEVLNK